MSELSLLVGFILHPWKYALPVNSIVAAAFNGTFRWAM
jgi:hypothetical protein